MEENQSDDDEHVLFQGPTYFKTVPLQRCLDVAKDLELRKVDKNFSKRFQSSSEAVAGLRAGNVCSDIHCDDGVKISLTTGVVLFWSFSVNAYDRCMTQCWAQRSER